MSWKKLGVLAALGFFVFVAGSHRLSFGKVPARAGTASRPGVGSLTLTNPPLPRPSGESTVGMIIGTTVANIVWHTVTRVIDGDTIEIETGDRVRYIGMNTPETVDPRKSVECLGKEASAYNHSLVEGKKVKLVSDITDKDEYGRLLRYVYLENGTFVNLKLVEEGYANVMTIPPNIFKAEEFRAAEREARSMGRGLWGACR